MITSPLLSNARHRAVITPVSPLSIGSFILARVAGQFFIRLKLLSKWELPEGLNFRCKFIASKNIQFDINSVLKNAYLHSCGCDGSAQVKGKRTKSIERLLRTILFCSGHLQHKRERPDMKRKYINSDKVQRKKPELTT